MQDYLIHYGILGQKWGVRRYQYEDGTLTPEGRERYYSKEIASGTKLINARGDKRNSQLKKDYNSFVKNGMKKLYSNPDFKKSMTEYMDGYKRYNTDEKAWFKGMGVDQNSISEDEWLDLHDKFYTSYSKTKSYTDYKDAYKNLKRITSDYVDSTGMSKVKYKQLNTVIMDQSRNGGILEYEYGEQFVRDMMHKIDRDKRANLF